MFHLILFHTLVSTYFISKFSISDHFYIKGAPENLSNNRFYEALDGPTFLLNFTDYGHADILDDWVKFFNSIFNFKDSFSNLGQTFSRDCMR